MSTRWLDEVPLGVGGGVETGAHSDDGCVRLAVEYDGESASVWLEPEEVDAVIAALLRAKEQAARWSRGEL